MIKEYTAENTKELRDIIEQISCSCEECRYVVNLKSGRYFIDDTIELTEKNSYTEFKAEGQVIFDGGIILKNEDVKEYKDNIAVIDLKPYNITLGEYENRGFRRSYVNAPNELFINDEPYVVARYPKDGVIKYQQGDIVDGGSIPKDHEYDMRCATIKCRDE